MTLTATTLTANLSANATDMDVAVAISNDAEGDFLVQIDEEFLLIERRGMTTNPQIKRRMYGTSPASHTSAEDVTPVIPTVGTGDPADPPGGGGGGGVTADNTVDAPFPMTNLRSTALTDLGSGDVGLGLVLRLLGPFTVDWDDGANLYLNNPGLKIADIPVGSLVLDIWASLTDPFVSDPPATGILLQVRLGDRYNLYSNPPDLSDEDAVPGSEDSFFDLVDSGNPWSVAQNFVEASDLGRFMPVLITASGGTPTPAAGNTSLSAWVQSTDPVIAGQFTVYALVASPV